MPSLYRVTQKGDRWGNHYEVIVLADSPEEALVYARAFNTESEWDTPVLVPFVKGKVADYYYGY